MARASIRKMYLAAVDAVVHKGRAAAPEMIYPPAHAYSSAGVHVERGSR